MIPPITTSPLQITNGISYSLRRIVWANTSIVDVCAVHTDYGQLLVLAADGSLSGVDFETGIITSLSKVALPEFNPTEGNEHFGMQALRLHASSNGKYAAIVIDFGRPGIVVEIRSGAVLMHLDGGDYCEETVPFGICFVHHNGRDVLVHRTAWNRLDVSDLASGELLTARDIAPYVSGGSRPEHYLDYFHGRLLPSPDGGRIFDDGWVWHPVSMPCAWSLTEWLNSNLWESEDGSSRVTLMSCDDWNKPACWIDEQHIALWGGADWDDEESAEATQGTGLRIVDTTTEKRSPGERWLMDVDEKTVRDIFSDSTNLYVVTKDGTMIWDITSRQHVASLTGFSADLFDRRRGMLIAFEADVIIECKL